MKPRHLWRGAVTQIMLQKGGYYARYNKYK